MLLNFFSKHKFIYRDSRKNDFNAFFIFKDYRKQFSFIVSNMEISIFFFNDMNNLLK